MSKQWSRIVAAGCGTLACLLVLAGSAAGFKNGDYAGTTSQDEEIRFTVTKPAVGEFEFTARVGCADGTAQTIDGSGGRTAIRKKGRFKQSFIGGGFTSVLKGKLRRKRATGKINVMGVAPSGASCSGSVEWTARRQK